MWVLFAILLAVFAALTSILAKIGISGVNSNLATAIRTVVVVFMAWGIVFITNAQSGIGDISRKVGCFDIVWACYWCFLVILLSRFTNGRRFKSSFDR